MPMMYRQTARADPSTVVVDRLPNASRLACFHRWSIALSSGVALGNSRTSIPNDSAQSRLSGAVCGEARSSKSTSFQPRQCDRTTLRKSWCSSWVQALVIIPATSPVWTLIAPWRNRFARLPVIGTRTCSPMCP